MSRRLGPRRPFRFPFFSRRQVERDVDEELRFHLDMKTEELIRAGVSPERARQEARRSFGDLEYTRRYCRDQTARRERGFWLRELWFDAARDLAHAWRHLRRNPAHSVVAVCVLALGIGASVAVFSVVNGVLLRPLPYQESDRLVRIWETGSRFDGRSVNVNPLNFLDLRSRARGLEELGGFFMNAVAIEVRGEAQLFTAAYVTEGLLQTLRLDPILGRTFSAEEDRERGPKVVLLGYGFWTNHMGADRSVVGTHLIVEGEPHEVVGVLEPEARLPLADRVNRPALWLPSQIGPHNGRGGHWLRAVGRLRSGVTLQQTEQELSTIARSLEETYPSSNLGVSVRLEPLRDSLVSGSRPAMFLLAGAVTLLLLLACGNVANILLARTLARRGELGVRAALGAGRGRLMRQLLAESLLLSLAGGVVGLALAALAVSGLKSFGPTAVPRLGAVGLDQSVVGFAIAASLFTALLVGLVPGIFGLGGSLRNSLIQAGPRGGGPSRSALRLEGGLAIFQIALATVLFTTAGLLFHSLLQLRSVDPGFETNNVVVIRVILPADRYPEGPERTAVLEDLLTRARALPAVAFAGASDSPPLQREQRSRSSFQPEDQPEPSADDLHKAWEQYITPGYLRAAGIPLLSGRDFDRRDDADSPGVILVNEVLARSIWPGESAVGKRIRYNGSREVIGVVGSTVRTGLGEEPAPEMILPYAQWPYGEALFVTLRSTLPARETITSFVTVLRQVDPGIPIGTTTTMRGLLRQSMVAERFRFRLLGAFAAVALILALVGVYGVLSYLVTRRRREFGLRMAVGADPGEIWKLVLRRGTTLTLIGLALGLIGSFLSARVLKAFLFGVGTTDPLTYGTVTALFLVVAVLASWIPAQRATRTDPTLTLRSD